MSGREGQIFLNLVLGNKSITPYCQVALQLYWNRTSACVFSRIFDVYFQNTLCLWRAASEDQMTKKLLQKRSDIIITFLQYQNFERYCITDHNNFFNIQMAINNDNTNYIFLFNDKIFLSFFFYLLCIHTVELFCRALLSLFVFNWLFHRCKT